MQRAFRSWVSRRKLLRDSVKVNGKVVRHEGTTTDGDIVSTCAPVVSYRAEDGQTYEVTLPPRHDTATCRIGMTVPIFYDRSKPRHAVDIKRMWDVNLACALSFFPVVIGAGLIFTAYQDTPQPKDPPRQSAAKSP